MLPDGNPIGIGDAARPRNIINGHAISQRQLIQCIASANLMHAVFAGRNRGARKRNRRRLQRAPTFS